MKILNRRLSIKNKTKTLNPDAFSQMPSAIKNQTSSLSPMPIPTSPTSQSKQIHFLFHNPLHLILVLSTG